MATAKKKVSDSVPFEGGTAIQKQSAATTLKKASKAKFKVPAKLGAVADLLYATRQKRLEIQKQVEELAAQESELREHIINNLPKSDAKGISGNTATVKVETSQVPTVKDWTKFQAYIKKTGNFELVQRRLNPKAIEELWEAKKKVPGVESFPVVKVSCTKL